MHKKRFVKYILGPVLVVVFALIVASAIFTGAKHIYADFSVRGDALYYSANSVELEPQVAVKTSNQAIFDTLNYRSKVGPSSLKLSSESYLIADLDSGEVIFSKDCRRILPIASVSKLFTSLVAIDNFNLSQTAIVSKTALRIPYGRTGNLRPGEKVKVADLLHLLLMESSNGTAEVLAEKYGRTAFIGKMNQKAKNLGLANTSFEDPSGLSPHNVSTALDLFRLSRYLYQEKKDVLDISKKQRYVTAVHFWHNKNSITRMTDYIGGKNGYTDEAKKTIISLFSMPVQGATKNRNLAIVLLRSEDLTGDVTKVKQFIKRNVYYDDGFSSRKTGDLGSGSYAPKAN